VVRTSEKKLATCFWALERFTPNSPKSIFNLYVGLRA